MWYSCGFLPQSSDPTAHPLLRGQKGRCGQAQGVARAGAATRRELERRRTALSGDHGPDRDRESPRGARRAECGHHEQGRGCARRDRGLAQESGAPEGRVQLRKAILMMRLVKPGRSAAWTKERIDALTTPEVRQLRDNAQRLGEGEIVSLCDEIIKVRPKTGVGARTKRPAAA